MKILQINKFLYPKGGAESYLLALSELLDRHGHDISYFSQKNKNNLRTADEKHFISEIHLDKFHWASVFNIGRIFWSRAAARQIRQLIEEEKPDIAHLHNIYHQLSPSILPVLHNAGIPIVMTVHDYKLISHDYTLRADGQKIRHKNSLLADLILRAEFMLHRRLKIYQKKVDAFIAPSEFVKNKLVEKGFAAAKIFVIPHFIDLSRFSGLSQTPQKSGSYLLFFGRLEESKGLEDLLNAYRLLINSKKASWPRLKIAGTGPLEKTLRQLAVELGLEKKVDFLGQVERDDLPALISGAKFTILPSRLHETFGLSVLESFACGRTAITTRVGALDEWVKNQINGLLVKPGDVKGLKKAMATLLGDRRLLTELNEQALATAQKYNPQVHYRQIIAVYRQLIKQKKSSPKSGLPEPPPRRSPFDLNYLIAIFLLIIAAVLIFQLTHPALRRPPGPGRIIGISENKYPRLANLYWRTPVTRADAQKLAKYDLVALDMNAQMTSADNIKYLRTLNPQIIILAYTSTNEIPQSRLSEVEPSGVGLWHDLTAGVKINWQLKTYEGKNVYWWPGNVSMNLYTKDENGRTYGDYLVDFYEKKILATGLWDGLLFDNIWQDVSWVDAKIDIDNDGRADAADKINRLWRAGHYDFFTKLRARIGNRYILLGNGVGQYSAWLNGRMLEGFPEQYENYWLGSMQSYQTNNATGTLPRINIVNADSDNTGNSRDYRAMRFGLANTLLGDGFYTFNYGPNLREDFWWYDEYDLELGEPLSAAFNIYNYKDKKIQASVWRRDFASGIVLVNSTAQAKTIKLEKEYRHVYGSQDMAVNNGEHVTSVTIPANDGLILLRQ